MYYLQSRYYDPAIGRFINADTFATTDANGFLSCNMFAYCENDPVNRKDNTGEFFTEAALTGAFVGSLWGICNGVISAAISGDDIFLAALEGAATGAITGIAAATSGSILFAAGVATLACGIVDTGLQLADKGKVKIGKSIAIGLQNGIDTIIGKGTSVILKDIVIKTSFTSHVVVHATKNLLSSCFGGIVNKVCKWNNIAVASNSSRSQSLPKNQGGRNSLCMAIK